MSFRTFDRRSIAGRSSRLRQRSASACSETLERRTLLSSAAPLNLLFFGNSFTNNTTDGSQYDMPATLKAIAVAAGDAAPNVYEQILLGETLADHLNTIAAAGSANIIQDSLPTGQSWNDVVLQEYSTRPTSAVALEGNVPLFLSDSLQLFNDVRANSPTVQGVLFETWARGSANSYYPTYFTGPADMQNQLQSNYALAASNINAADGAGSMVVSPAGEAWRSLGWESSLYSTIAADGVEYHPSTEGELLNAMMIFDSIYHSNVANIPLGNVTGILSNLGLSSAIWNTLASVASSFAQPASGGSLAASQSSAAAGYNLTSLGSSDWAHWGTGNVFGSFNHDAAGNSQISNVAELGSGNYGSYFDTSRNVSWSNGTPLASDAGDDAYVWANNTLGAGYTFTVAASTTPQTLYFYAGGYESQSMLRAHLSDGSAVDFTATASGSGHYTQLYTIKFQAASSGQTLTISYSKAGNINGTGGSVDLIAAALAGPASVDVTPPTATLTSAPAQTTAGNSAYIFTVTYADNIAVQASSLGNQNILVTGPNGYSQLATPVTTGISNGASIAATYSVSPPPGGWNSSDDGSYTISLQAGQVFDTSGNSAIAGTLGTFTANIPAAGFGSLLGTQAAAAAGYNLTSLGSADWIHWGTGNNPTAVDRKATGKSQISNATRIGTGSYGSYFDSSRNVMWTDGTPLATDTGDDAYIWANNSLGAGYSFTVPAGTTTHTLYIYAGGYSSGATLTAHLSDGSASDYVASASGSAHYTQLYTITFNAASAGQTLTVTYIKSANVNGTGGSVDLIAAALA